MDQNLAGAVHGAGLDTIASVDRAAIIHSGQPQFTDLVGGKLLGLTIAWINRRGIALDASAPEPDYVFSDVKSLLGLLKV